MFDRFIEKQLILTPLFLKYSTVAKIHDITVKLSQSLIMSSIPSSSIDDFY